MMQHPQQSGTAFRLRGLTRFSVRTLVIALSILGIWLGLHVRSVNRQQDSVAAVTRHGGWVYYDYELLDTGLRDPQAQSPVPQWLLSWLGPDHFHDVVGVNMMSYQSEGTWQSNQNRSGDVLWHLAGFPQLDTLVLQGTQATDEGLKRVGRLKQLRHLHIFDAAHITDRGIGYLADLRKLETLQLDQGQVTDDTLQIVGRLSKLQAISIQGNRFTDEGLKHLGALKHLRELWIGNGRFITDAGVVHLAKLESLEVLDLHRTQVTDEGLQALANMKSLKRLLLRNSRAKDASHLKTALPKCKIDL